MKLSAKLSALLFLPAFGTASAQGLLLPDTQLREHLDWLDRRGVIVINTHMWPLGAAEVEAALANAKPVSPLDEEMIGRVRARVAALKAGAEISARTSAHHFPAMTAGFGRGEYDRHRLSAALQYQNDFADVRLQANVVGGDGADYPSRWLPSGSYAAVRLGNHWLSFGQMPRWWGPAHGGSLIVGNHARPVTAFALQRAEHKPFETPWLSWMGRWQYQVFAGQLSQYNAVPDAKLIGLRLEIMPTDYFSLAAFRTMQWGGEGRPQTLKSFGKALIGRGDNADTPQERAKEPGNQIAGLDFRLKLRPLLGVPVSVYTQMIGEDEAGLFPAKKAWLFGVDGAHDMRGNAVNWSLEMADTRVEFDDTNIIYRHHIYTDGYYQQGLPLGYVLGGDVRSVRAAANVTTPQEHTFSGQLLYARAYSATGYLKGSDTLSGISLGWRKTLQKNIEVATDIWYLHSKNHLNRDGLGAGLRLSMPLDIY